MTTWSQVRVIIWAQWRTVRNHLPRAGFALIVGNLLSVLWYVLILTGACFLAVAIPLVPADEIYQWLPAALLGVSVVWQVIPLFTLSSGWALQLNKLQMYPLRTEALFGIEVLLRVTASPELILILLGGTVGLLRHPDLPTGASLFTLVLLPFNLLLSLAIREMVLHSFERNRFREIFSILLISIAVLPQVILRGGLGGRTQPYLLFIAGIRFSPWNATAALALGRFSVADLLAILLWMMAAYLLARWFFVRSLAFEETAQAGSLATISGMEGPLQESRASGWTAKLLGDPLAALVQKEVQGLIRMPRFRVAFGMACVFGVLILLPMSMNGAHEGGLRFLNRNFVPITTMYGLLILSDSLLMNVFGTDRAGAALYFLSPLSIRTVLWAKNLTAVFFLAVQSALVMLVASAIRRSFSPLEAVTAVCAVAVTGLFFLSVGNLTSVRLARPSDPKQTMRKAAGGKLQLWMSLCVVGMGVLVGAAYLARWALDSSWAMFGVLAVEFAIGLIVYKVALDSAVEYAEQHREKLMDSLSKGVGLVGSTS